MAIIVPKKSNNNKQKDLKKKLIKKIIQLFIKVCNPVRLIDTKNALNASFLIITQLLPFPKPNCRTSVRICGTAEISPVSLERVRKSNDFYDKFVIRLVYSSDNDAI